MTFFHGFQRVSCVKSVGLTFNQESFKNESLLNARAEPKKCYFWGMSQKWHFYLTHVPDAESFKNASELNARS